MRSVLRAGLLVLPVFALLVGLGTWQLQRLAWKTDLLARIDAAEAAPPRPLVDPPEPFTKVVATGRFANDREALLGVEVRGTTLGAHLVVPLQRQDGPPVLVDRGWVPIERGQPVAHPEGEQQVVGWVRPGEAPGWFAARDDAAARRFYSFDPAAIGAALGLPAVAPYGVVALGEGGMPAPARHLPRPPNNHLGYVITWYGLAAALVGVFVAWARRRLKDAA